MSVATYAVVMDLGLQHYDDARTGYAAARGAFAEVRRLARADDRVRTARMRRDGPLAVQIALTVRAGSSGEAVDVGRAIIRSAVHANGGSTAGWDDLRPDADEGPAPSPRRRRGRRRDRSTATRRGPAAPTWGAIGAESRLPAAEVADRRPPLEPDGPDGVVVDLR